MSDPSSPIPLPSPTDHEDVSWALSTAEANWKRGDHADALKWLQRAAEAASEAGLDARYLELAKAASELAGRVESAPRLPRPQAPEDPHPSGSTIVQPMGVVLPEPARKSGAPAPRRSAPPARAASVPPRANTAPPRANTTPPRAPSKPIPPRVPAPTPSRPVVGAGVGAGAGARKDAAPEPPPPAESGASMKTGERPRNMPHLSALTRSPDSTAPRTVPQSLEPDDHTELMGPGSAAPQTEVHPHMGDRHADVPESAPEIDPWPTPMRDVLGDATLVPDPRDRPPSAVTTQALRVMLYRTHEGVKIAPAGSKIPGISIEAMLVALDPEADLTAWLK